MKLKELLKFHEGLRLQPYKCPAGHWTIGYGHNLEARNEPIPLSITAEDAELYLDRDIAEATRSCERLFPSLETLDEVRQAVLVDMSFNMGPGSLSKFKRFRAAVERKHWEQAAVEMLDSLWARQVGVRAARLAGMMQSGQWPDLAPA